jgi:hypothetical protein
MGLTIELHFTGQSLHEMLVIATFEETLVSDKSNPCLSAIILDLTIYTNYKLKARTQRALFLP